jgi:hypothetical protein
MAASRPLSRRLERAQDCNNKAICDTESIAQRCGENYGARTLVRCNVSTPLIIFITGELKG